MSEDRKTGPGIRTKPHSIRDKAMAVNDTVKRGSEKARFAQRRADVKPDESKSEGDAVGTVEETEQQLASDAEHAGKALLRRASAASRKKREAARLSEEKDSDTANNHNPVSEGAEHEKPRSNAGESVEAGHEATTTSQLNAGTESRNSVQSIREAKASDAPTANGDQPRRARQNRSKLKRKDAVSQNTTDAPVGNVPADQSQDKPASAPRNRLLSADELESARERKFRRIEAETAMPAERPMESTPTKVDSASKVTVPRVRRQKSDLYHERPAAQLPRGREILREPVVGSRVIESAPRVEIRTADASAKAAGKAASAAADAAKKKVADEATKKVASHMKELSRKAAERSAKALKASAKAAMRAVEAAGRALAATIASGGGVVTVIILVILMCASILASPFGIFTHASGIENPDSNTLDNAITTINEEYVSEVKSKARGADNVSILIEGNIEGDIEPANWVDVLGVFAVHVTMRDENAMNIVDLGEAQLKELRTVFWDMNKITTVKETEDGETTTYVLGQCLTYMDMVEKYHFTEQQKQLLNEIMSDEYYAFWSNFVSASMGYGDTDWTGITSAPDDDDSPGSAKPGYTPSFSGGSMKIPKIYQYDYKKTVCRIGGENKSASTSGCGATSMCMVIHYLTGNTSPTPYTLFKWAYDNGKYNGNGLDHSTVSAMGKLYGVTGSWVGKDGKKIVSALTSGHPVIAHMGPGVFTKGGHYIVLRGVTKDGKILVNDPASSSRTGKAYPLSTILKEGKTSTPFMICSKAG